MGLSQSDLICSHPNLKIIEVVGPTNYDGKYDDPHSSFALQFANLSCSDCNMNCYRYNACGMQKGHWKPWLIENDAEKTSKVNKAH